MMQSQTLVYNIGQLVTPHSPNGAALRGTTMRDLRILEKAAMLLQDGRIAWLGPEKDLPAHHAAQELDARGMAVLPGLVDPHTHAVWAGERLGDFEARASGKNYEAILAAGGGIRHTMRQTQQATRQELLAAAWPRLQALLASGATTTEIKSGYGFDSANETKMLEVIRDLRDQTAQEIVATALIHVPPSDPKDREAYIQEICEVFLPQAKPLASAVDVFTEQESFTVAETRRIFVAAQQLGFALKLHSDQFHSIGGVELALEFGALSVDHLEAAGAQQIAALAQSQTVAVLLPGVSLHLGLPNAPGRALVDAGAAVAVGTDLNPGSSPVFSTRFALALAVRLNRLTPAEALCACTVNAAAALGLKDRGVLRVSARADFLLLGAHDWREIAYGMGHDDVVQEVFVAGQAAHQVSQKTKPQTEPQTEPQGAA